MAPPVLETIGGKKATMSSENACYGNMFPLLRGIVHNQPVYGQVFGYRVNYAGGVAQEREAMVNRTGWEKCLQCPQMEACYRLSTGNFLMELALRTVPQTLY
jgi:hypothetical protein